MTQKHKRIIDLRKIDTNEAQGLERMIVREDPFYLIENGLLKIKTKHGEFIPLKLNFTQQYVLNIIKKAWIEGKAIRLLILKARQEGISTESEAIIYSIISTQPNRNGVIVADDDDGANYLFEMSKTYHDASEDHLKPILKRSNRKELVFKAIRSAIYVQTANKPNSVRKYTYQIAHLSEFALFPYPNELMTALNQTVPNLPKTIIIIETTAKGKKKIDNEIRGKVGNGSRYFYDEWKKAKAGETDWIAVFIPWFWHEEYTTPIYEDGERIALENSLDDEEKNLLKTLNLRTGRTVSLEQIKWRRWCIKNNCGGDVENFHQEYPSTDEEAFIIGGNPYFDVKTLREMRTYCINPKTGDLQWEYDRIVFRNKGVGNFKIIEDPVPYENYIIGADVAAGINGGDYSVIEVLNARTLMEVAQWRGWISPELFGYELNKVGLYYNKALVGCEVNQHGLTSLIALKNLNYPNIYFKQSFQHGEPKSTGQIGWLTNTLTKSLMCESLAQLIRDKSLRILLEDTIDELLDFGQNLEAMSRRDDIVISLAIAVELWKLHPYLRKQKEKEDYIPMFYQNRSNNLSNIKKGGRCGYGG